MVAGKAALSSLEKARELLSSAQGWGIYDTFFSGGMLSGIIKHSKMEDAEECIERAKDNLFRFSEEHKDPELAGINLNTRDFIALTCPDISAIMQTRHVSRPTAHTPCIHFVFYTILWSLHRF